MVKIGRIILKRETLKEFRLRLAIEKPVKHGHTLLAANLARGCSAPAATPAKAPLTVQDELQHAVRDFLRVMGVEAPARYSLLAEAVRALKENKVATSLRTIQIAMGNFKWMKKDAESVKVYRKKLDGIVDQLLRAAPGRPAKA